MANNNFFLKKSIIFHNKYNFISDLKIPENIPKYLKKAVMVFNEIMTDLRALSIQWEDKINELYALFVSLEWVNMRYIEKIKSRNNNPQTSEQLKTRLQICKNMKQVLTKTKSYEDLLTEPQKNLLPKSCNIDPLKPHSDNLKKLTNPYFERPLTKPAPIPDLLTKNNFTSKVNKDRLTEMSSSSATTKPTKVTLKQSEDTVQSPKEYPTSTISTKMKKLHPWCKSTRTAEEVKDMSTGETSPAKQQATNPTKLILSSSNLAETEHSEDSEEDLLKTSSKTDSRENIEMETKQKREEDVKLKKNETGTEQQEVEEVKENESFLSSTPTTVPQQKSNIKCRIQNNHNPASKKKEVLSIAQEEEAYPWQKEAAKNIQNETPLSNQIQKIKEGACKLLPPVMKSKTFSKHCIS